MVVDAVTKNHSRASGRCLGHSLFGCVAEVTGCATVLPICVAFQHVLGQQKICRQDRKEKSYCTPNFSIAHRHLNLSLKLASCSFRESIQERNSATPIDISRLQSSAGVASAANPSGDQVYAPWAQPWI